VTLLGAEVIESWRNPTQPLAGIQLGDSVHAHGSLVKLCLRAGGELDARHRQRLGQRGRFQRRKTALASFALTPVDSSRWW